jgi:predicted  nucleic acid-binding Zn-ribbon protein
MEEEKYTHTNVGKVYTSLGGWNKCPDCGTKTYNYTWLKIENGADVTDTVRNNTYENQRVTVCMCGNVFVRQRPVVEIYEINN